MGQHCKLNNKNYSSSSVRPECFLSSKNVSKGNSSLILFKSNVKELSIKSTLRYIFLRRNFGKHSGRTELNNTALLKKGTPINVNVVGV